MTPDVVWALRPADRGQQAVDLSAIRRTDALIDLLASRRLLRPRALGDPVIALLSSLNSDVDSPGRAPRARAFPRTAAFPRVPASGRALSRWVPLRPGAAAPGGRRYYGAHRRHGGPWVRAVSAAMVFVAVAVTAAGLMVVSVIARLTGVTGRGRTRP